MTQRDELEKIYNKWVWNNDNEHDINKLFTKILESYVRKEDAEKQKIDLAVKLRKDFDRKLEEGCEVNGYVRKSDIPKPESYIDHNIDEKVYTTPSDIPKLEYKMLTHVNNPDGTCSVNQEDIVFNDLVDQHNQFKEWVVDRLKTLKILYELDLEPNNVLIRELDQLIKEIEGE